jgi:hypothetical protein
MGMVQSSILTANFLPIRYGFHTESVYIHTSSKRFVEGVKNGGMTVMVKQFYVYTSTIRAASWI